MIHKTTNIPQAAALMAQKEFKSTFKELQITPESPKVEFILELEATPEILQNWIVEYINRRICVEPKTYHQCVNTLRDNMNNYKYRKI